MQDNSAVLCARGEQRGIEGVCIHFLFFLSCVYVLDFFTSRFLVNTIQLNTVR